MRRRLIVLAAFLTSFILGICAQIIWLSLPRGPNRDRAETLQGTVSPDYNLTGSYYPADELQWAFFYVRRIDLTTMDVRVNQDSSLTMTAISPSGYLVTDFDVYRMSSVNIDAGQLSFTTEPRVAVSYQFTGRVLAQGDYPVKGYSQYYIGKTIMVEGRIVRILFGFKVAENEVRFTKGSGC